MIDIRDLIDQVRGALQRHHTGRPGEYTRWLWQDDGGSRDLGVTAYGCADAACILYTLDELPGGAIERQAWIEALQRFQDPSTGLFDDPTHDAIHTTAFCLAALNLFEARAQHPIAALHYLLDRQELVAYLEALDWSGEPWLESHKGAGIYSSLALNREANDQWEGHYFDWLWENEDPDTGLWRRGEVRNNSKKVPVFHHLGGSFHYLFNLVYARRPQRYPEKAVDTCIGILERNEQPLYGARFRAGVSFADIDWFFYLNRSLRQCGHRFEEAKAAMERAATEYIDFLEGIDYATHDGFNNLHTLFGMVCALSEIQQALPGFLKTDRPLRQVLDRRPFI